MKKIMFIAAAALCVAACNKAGNDTPVNPTSVTWKGVTYKVVTLKNGSVWMAENLRYVPDGMTPSSDLNNVSAGVYCPIVVNGDKTAAAFSTDEAVIKTNGYLYQSEVALGLKVGDIKSEDDAKKLEGVQGICPDGWHIPTITDITSLVGKAVSPVETDKSAPYYNGKDGSITLLNEDGFNAAAWGAVSIIDKTKKAGTFMGFLKAYPDRITSGYLCGSSFAGITYNTAGDVNSGIKNVQFYGLMPMTNKATEEDYTFNGAKLSYLIAAPVRCVMNK